MLKHVPIFITSADADRATFERHKRLKTRAQEYLKKPFEPESLIPILTRYLAQNDDPVHEPRAQNGWRWALRLGIVCFGLWIPAHFLNPQPSQRLV